MAPNSSTFAWKIPWMPYYGNRVLPTHCIVKVAHWLAYLSSVSVYYGIESLNFNGSVLLIFSNPQFSRFSCYSM